MGNEEKDAGRIAKTRRVVLGFELAFIVLVSIGLYAVTHDVGLLVSLLIVLTIAAVLGYKWSERLGSGTNEGFDKIARASKPGLIVFAVWGVVSAILGIITLALLLFDKV